MYMSAEPAHVEKDMQNTDLGSVSSQAASTDDVMS